MYHEFTTPYTLKLNGVAESKNRNVVQLVRRMLKAKELPNEFWAEEVATSIYQLNISPTKTVINRTPYDAWHERKFRIGHLKIFGCDAYTLINSQNRRKIDEKSEKFIFIGYCIQSKGYRLYIPDNKKFVISS